MCKETNCDILAIQETHRGISSHRPNIIGMNLVIERPHTQYGSVIFAKPDIEIVSTDFTCNQDIEVLTVEIPTCSITSVYKPPGENFQFTEPRNLQLPEWYLGLP